MNEAVIKKTNFNFPGQTGFYRGKVRDVYYFHDKMAVVTTDRISAFDVILPNAIPYKGQVLNLIAAQNLEATRDIVPNWVIDVPVPNVMWGVCCKPFPVEMVVRHYLTGHAWRIYAAGKRKLSGVILPEGLKENDPFPKPIITPTTKADSGHDQDISKEEIIRKGLMSEQEYGVVEELSLRLFNRGTNLAKDKGLILVDTKYEFGKYNDKIYLIDEAHTPDSSRYFYQDLYEQRQKEGMRQKQLSKEFVREWLISRGFQGEEGKEAPFMDDDIVKKISNRYIELYEVLMGKKFVPYVSSDIISDIKQSISDKIHSLI